MKDKDARREIRELSENIQELRERLGVHWCEKCERETFWDKWVECTPLPYTIRCALGGCASCHWRKPKMQCLICGTAQVIEIHSEGWENLPK